MAEALLKTQQNQADRFLGMPFPWVIAGVGALLLLSVNIHSNTFGVFFKPISEEFGWSRGAMSGAFAIRSLVTAALVVSVGYWSDRYGPRRVLIPCFLLLGLSMIATTRVSTLWQMYLVQGLGIGVASAGPFVCVTSSVAKWHGRRRGLALGIAVAGLGVSSIIFPPLATKLIEAFGWRWAISILGLAIMVLGAPGSLAMRDPPAKLRGPASAGAFEALHLLPRLLKNGACLAAMLIFLFMCMANSLLQGHLVNYATDIGISALVAATMMSAMGIGGTLGRVGMGFVSDKTGSRVDAGICCTLLAVALMLLLSQVTALMWIGVVLFGIGAGGASPLITAMMGEHLDTERLATATAIATVGATVGNAIGPWIAGFMFDISGSYLWAMLLAIAGSLAALTITILLPRRGHPSWQKAHQLLER